ncbi:hypothetical protein AB0I22_32715 [Streptomyces sp. NPDC050610]|uniref:hypothetical protein n=1 Tax=Streptomyces sp. NPDC050610 TaxID=3157097 RepID=UPI00341B18C4
MRKSVMRRVGVSLVVVTALVGMTGCQAGADKAGRAGSPDNTGNESSRGGGDARTPEQAITAAYKKTSAAKSARVVMTTSTPAEAGVSRRTTASGVMGWNPTAEDVTVDRGGAGEPTGRTAKMRMIWVDDVLYMDKGKSKELTGKKWVKLDMVAAAEEAGDAQAVKLAASELEGTGDDPARKLALLLNAPVIEHVGSEDIGGGRAEHYKGAFTVESVLKSAKKIEALTPQQREKQLADIEETGMDSYDFDVWVNSDDFPVKMNIWMKSPKGVTTTSADFSDYGTKVAVQAPPAGDTVDMSEMIKESLKRELDKGRGPGETT